MTQARRVGLGLESRRDRLVGAAVGRLEQGERATELIACQREIGGRSVLRVYEGWGRERNEIHNVAEENEKSRRAKQNKVQRLHISQTAISSTRHTKNRHALDTHTLFEFAHSRVAFAERRRRGGQLRGGRLHVGAQTRARAIAIGHLALPRDELLLHGHDEGGGALRSDRENERERMI